ncbi:transforming growth factor beta-1-induced transcript 1 protein isoform X1 [Phymastichus coffea]|uniref:transforming growth factor beta-1-induced transcript 1 protein isoform X1 n=1 Tax=Phymastichus coffea TaxID=108790 RepID=UPI00273CACA2|nr:transforming growth factor beta-1-induced transcript 1 protein isoform X1 [Phymastichus coffea]
MGLQLSVLFGCVGAIELLACLKHMVVCKMQLIHDLSHCKVDYFHRPSATGVAEDFVIIDKASLDDEHQACSEIEAILRQNKAEPNVLFIGPPPSIEGYVRVPTPIPFGMDDQIQDQKSSSNSSLVDSGNENPTRQTPVDNSPVIVKSVRGSSSDVSSLEDTENHPGKTNQKKIVRRSRTPEIRSGSYEDYDEEDQNIKHKKHLATLSKKSLKSKLKSFDLRRSAENLASPRRSKRQRDPERCKSDIQIQVSRNALRDEWTNTSPIGSEISVAKNNKSISVFIQTSFEDKLRENMSLQNLETISCPNCRCVYKDTLELRKISETDAVDGKAQLLKISSFEEASDNDYTKLKDTMTNKKNWIGKVKSSLESESLDEYVDAEEDGMTFCDQPIQYSIPDHPDNQAFWLIFSGDYTKAMNKDWHSSHFCCWQCDESLTGQRYVLRDEHPYCIKCYESVFANGCEECHKIIGIDSKDLSYKDKHWHEACFLCSRCRVSLVDKQFGSKVDKIYCGNCYDSQFASRCDGCGEIFRAGTKKMEYKTRQWHEKCFCCVVCKSPIGTKSFIPREQEIYCAGCYEDKFSTRCVKCNKIITTAGVTYKNEPWHRDCFTCTHCDQSLAGQRFTSRDDKPYCADCFGELFAKRCTACSKPITGIGGTRFISFEDRHWHNDCFICAGCNSSMVGRGFITDGEDIICPECAKQKLS